MAEVMNVWGIKGEESEREGKLKAHSHESVNVLSISHMLSSMEYTYECSK